MDCFCMFMEANFSSLSLQRPTWSPARLRILSCLAQQAHQSLISCSPQHPGKITLFLLSHPRIILTSVLTVVFPKPSAFPGLIISIHHASPTVHASDTTNRCHTAQHKPANAFCAYPHPGVRKKRRGPGQTGLIVSLPPNAHRVAPAPAPGPSTTAPGVVDIDPRCLQSGGMITIGGQAYILPRDPLWSVKLSPMPPQPYNHLVIG